MLLSKLHLATFAFLVSCASPRPATAPSPEVPDLASHYDRCATYDQERDVPKVLRCLEALERLGWSLALEPSHFEASREHSEFQALEQRLAARAPRVSRSQIAFTAPAELVPENVAFDPKTGAFFLGSIPQRKIVRVASGVVQDFTHGDIEPRLLSALGMKVDPVRRTLWAATAKTRAEGKGQSALAVFDVDTGELLARFAPEDGRAHLFNDVVITAAEDVFVTDSVGGGVYRVSSRAALRAFLPAGTFSYPNGIALSRDEKKLYVAHEKGIAVVDIATAAYSELQHPPEIPIAGVDGLYLHRDALVAVQNGIGRGRIVRWKLEGSRISQIEILEAGSPMLERPTTGTIVGDRFYYIANYQGRRLGPDGVTAKKPLEDVRVLSMPLN